MRKTVMGLGLALLLNLQSYSGLEVKESKPIYKRPEIVTLREDDNRFSSIAKLIDLDRDGIIDRISGVCVDKMTGSRYQFYFNAPIRSRDFYDLNGRDSSVFEQNGTYWIQFDIKLNADQPFGNGSKIELNLILSPEDAKRISLSPAQRIFVYSRA